MKASYDMWRTPRQWPSMAPPWVLHHSSPGRDDHPSVIRPSRSITVSHGSPRVTVPAGSGWRR
ncbi:hypothetical protein STRIP9103_01817 [Streptomyces ipomoeae 91-03]|uniref:Uncharacterized protein n=1 Tax=Streptomyces ipomoeae 91-03 TaxID=698759 RepID=L1L6L5_9ACTN|nr:hypothetical protein STRIP9103_01817 [Streptomyces ipomoeae 91-03]